MSSRPLNAEWQRDEMGVAVLCLYHLDSDQLRGLQEVMLVNGNSYMHDIRSHTRAHLGMLDTFEGIASIHMYREDEYYLDKFLNILSRKIGVELNRELEVAG